MTKNKDVKTLWESPPPRERKTAYAKWFYRTMEQSLHEKIERAKHTKTEDIVWVDGKHGKEPDRSDARWIPFFRKKIDVCKRMQLCLDKHGLRCLGDGAWIDDNGNIYRKD
jgi:hypothetical protein